MLLLLCCVVAIEKGTAVLLYWCAPVQQSVPGLLLSISWSAYPRVTVVPWVSGSGSRGVLYYCCLCVCGGSGLGNNVVPRIQPAAPRFARLLADVNVCKDLQKTPRFPRFVNLWPDLESDISSLEVKQNRSLQIGLEKKKSRDILSDLATIKCGLSTCLVHIEGGK